MDSATVHGLGDKAPGAERAGSDQQVGHARVAQHVRRIHVAMSQRRLLQCSQGMCDGVGTQPVDRG
jgi:hypothetical protein